MVRRSRDDGLQRALTHPRCDHGTRRARRGERCRGRSAVRALRAFRLRTCVARRCDVVCRRHGDQPHCWSRHLRIGRRVRPRGRVRAAAEASGGGHDLRGALLVVEPARRRVSRDCAGGVCRARSATDASCRWSRSRARSRRLRCSRCRSRPPAISPTSSGHSVGISLSAPSSRSPLADARSCSSGPRSTRWPRPRRISFRARSAETSVVAVNTSLARCSRARSSPAGVSCSSCSRRRCSCGSGFPRSTASSGPIPIRRRIPRTTRRC